MTKGSVPPEARAALRAELDADTADYRDKLAEGEWRKSNRSSSPLLTVRVPADVLEKLQALAEESGVSVSALTRQFIAEGLSNRGDEDLVAALDRLERDVAAVKARAQAG
ncbi:MULTISPECIES: ribbon-helix-helix protein, CopG family [unclassified Brevibacterium]|uniref:ribbon-helix-helix protein, CopG family n=1 Tax=unclassified Brevibacterium TaxID=2614124 RepID=UPI0014858D6A|nr:MULTISPECIES: ribbon-helix-helix protein, CopG family [unclassified Brevibacterium]MCM1013665.1 ribbon-helix-helix protein, CopG family [Brevibacterium sp. XM4083]